mgnify:CR=1 FL=1
MENIKYCMNCCKSFYIENLDKEYFEFCCDKCGKEYYKLLTNKEHKIKYE